jgi:GNAT superfamily N-acetyltransferase
MDDLALVIEENAARFLLAMGRAGGGEERNDPHLRWTVGGSPVGYHNAVVHTDLEADEVFPAIEEWGDALRRHGVPGSWHCGPSTRPPHIHDRLALLGYTLDEEVGMSADLTSLTEAPDRPKGLRIEAVRDLDALDAWMFALGQGFGDGPLEATWVRNVYASIGLGDDVPWLHHVAFLDGEPAATCSTFFTDDLPVAGIYFVSTVPHLRRRGIGAAITARAMRDARDHDCDTAVLGASKMGEPVYRSLGFEERCRIRVMEWSPGPRG